MKFEFELIGTGKFVVVDICVVEFDFCFVSCSARFLEADVEWLVLNRTEKSEGGTNEVLIAERWTL